MINYSITTATLGIVTVAAIFFLIRKHSLYVRYTVWWVVVSIGVLVFSIFPQLADKIVKFLGINYAPTLFLFCAILMLFLKTLLMDIDRSKQEVKIRRLVQRLAILEAGLEKEHKK
jgi:hypothetical protein